MTTPRVYDAGPQTIEPQKRLGLLIALAVLVAIALLGGVYLTMFGGSSKDELTLDAPPGAGANVAGEPTGRWVVADGSEAGYRVREKLAELPAKSDAVGRTDEVSGGLVVSRDGDTLRASDLSFEVDVLSLESDKDRRDNRIRTQGLESEQYPKATFEGTKPVEVPSGLADGETVTVPVEGELTIHGVTKTVTVPVQARLTGDKVEVAGSITFPMADYDIEPPTIPPFVQVDPDATMEFKLVLEREA